ncbi:AraC family transcriptional regulator N-terminal domain-containing protein [Paenibacillus sp. W4I10]|uniref:AraC family transcriptional regulator N-terminal domain-containing protein n=1 Tax=Paenibacillus sp. W4I10 TaxID=3042298 RepID=UPI00358DEEBE
MSEGGNTTPIPYVSIYRYTQKDIILPETTNPFVFLILSGTMRLHFSSGFKEYSPGHFMISAIDSPLTGQALSVSEDSPFLAISINFFIEMSFQSC